MLFKLQKILPRPTLTIYKSFIKPHLEYGDTTYDQAYNNYYDQKVEAIQYNFALVITGTIWGASGENLDHELSQEFLENRRWYRKRC